MKHFPNCNDPCPVLLAINCPMVTVGDDEGLALRKAIQKLHKEINGKGRMEELTYYLVTEPREN